MNSNKAFLIFSGYNFRAVVAFLRFAKANSITCFIVARDSGDPVYYTDYKERVIFERTNADLNLSLFEDVSKVLCKQFNGEVFILPSTEGLNRFLIASVVELKKLQFQVPLVDKELYELISDKEAFKNYCKHRGILVPEDLEFKNCTIPFVAKPKTYSVNGIVSSCPYLIHCEEDLKLFLETENVNDFFYQNYIGGSSHYLLYHFSKSGKVTSFGQENLIQQSGGKSVIAAQYSQIHKETISEKFEKLLLEMNFFGLIMIEIRRSNFDDFMIEANPRLWGPSQFFLDNGSDIFGQFAKELGFAVRKPIISTGKDCYFWNGGMVGNRLKFHENTCYRFLRHYGDFLKNDIYLRPDSFQYYYKEINDK